MKMFKICLKVIVMEVFLFLSLFAMINSECNANYGCLARQKFMSYVTVQSKDGTALPLRTIMNYKVIYVFTDRVVFYSSSDAGTASLEPEESSEQIEKIEAKVERVINFGDILLDCGKFHNKLCHVQEYQGIEQSQSFKAVQKVIKNENANVYCLVVPFFENGYQKAHEKMAYICISSSQDLYNLITFKNYLSRRIELYQLKMSNDRFSAFNGLSKRKAKFISVVNGKTVPVIARIYNRGIALSLNDDTHKFLKFYSFYQQRFYKNGAYIVSQGLKKNKIDKNWSNGLSPEPSGDCCIYFKGETESLPLCIAGVDGKSVESASDICQSKMKSIFSTVWSSLRGIKFAEAYFELSHNSQKLADCKSSEYKFMKWRAERTITYAIEVDCNYVMNYVNGDTYSDKFRFCHKNYGDELKLELKLMSLDNDDIYDGINNCVYKDPTFSKVFEEEHFTKLMEKAKLYTPDKTTSFLQINSGDEEDIMSTDFESDSDSESDDIDDDDDADATTESSKNSHKKSNDGELNKEIINFTQLKSKTQSESSSESEISNNDKKKKKEKKKRHITDFVYSKPKESYGDADVNRMKIFRNTQMKELQQTHTWTPAPRESINEKFNKVAASLGKSNSDEFVSFLGYLRDASYRASKLIAKNNEKKLEMQKLN